MTNSVRAIWQASCFLLLPLAALTATFSSLLVCYQIPRNDHSNFQYDENMTVLEESVFYNRLNSTLLLSFASAGSTIYPILTGCVASLVAYPVAQSMLEATRCVDQERMLSPSQLALLIQLLKESAYTSILALTRYRYKQKRPTHCRFAVSWITLFAILGVLNFAADQWLHFVTSTVWISTASPLPTAHAAYSLNLAPGCLTTNNSIAALQAVNKSCSYNSDNREAVTFTDPAVTMETVNNQSSQFSVKQYQADPSTNYLSVASSAIDSAHDFTAKTFGIRTTCQTISERCNLTLDGDVAFNCNNGAWTEPTLVFEARGLGMISFRYADMSDNSSDFYRLSGVANPFYWGVSLMYASPAHGQQNVTDSGFLFTEGYVAAVLFCTATLLDIQYDQVEGQVTGLTSSIATDSTANVFNSVPAAIAFGVDNTALAMSLAVTISNKPQDYLDSITKSLSNMLLSSGAGSVIRTPALVAQKRTNILVTRLPKPAVYSYIGTNLIILIMGGFLTMHALSVQKDARAAQMYLSIPGLVSTTFETDVTRGPIRCVDELFDPFVDEDVKVSLSRTEEGGVAFVAKDFKLDDL